MKNSLFFTMLVFVYSFTQAQDIQITYSGSGESSDVDSVQVTNLTQRTAMTIAGSDVLYLQGTVGLNDFTGMDDALNIYPNPIRERSKIAFYADKSTEVQITIFDVAGRLVTNHSEQIQKGISSFEISGLSSGIYALVVSSDEWNHSAKLIATSTLVDNANIRYLETNTKSGTQTGFKNSNDLVPMQYNDGDRMMFIGYSMNYGRVITMVPTMNINVDFNYVDCTDGDGDFYPVVTYGDQTWMAESLRTTKLNDGTDIPFVNDSQEWNNLTTPAYNYQLNDLTLKLKLGALYNHFAVESEKLCPIGWRVPSQLDYNALIDYGGGNWNIGGQLKEQGTIENEDGYWHNPNTNADNSWGFRLRAAGEFSTFRDYAQLGYNSYTWTSTDNDDNTSFYFTVSYDSDYTYLYNVSKNEGLAVRCIKDD